MRAKLNMVIKMRLTEKVEKEVLDEEKFLEYLKHLNFGVRKSGTTYNMRLSKTVKNEDQAEQIKEVMRGYGSIHKTTSRNKKTGKEYVYYQYSISHSEVKEIFYNSFTKNDPFKYLYEYFKEYKNEDEIISEIMAWVTYTDDVNTVGWQRAQGREEHYETLKKLLEDEKKPKSKMSAEEKANLENEKVKKSMFGMNDDDLKGD